ncbi:MAG: hypothetical protein QXG16_02660 [Candidatus Anstonellaceae archaeon]
MKNFFKFFITIFFILLLVLFYLEVNKKNKELEEIKREFFNYKESVTKKIEQLNLEIKRVVEENRLIKKELEDARGELKQKIDENNQLKEELEKKQKSIEKVEREKIQKESELKKLKEEYVEILEEINKSMEWFKQNSFIEKNYSWNSDILLERIEKDCVYKNKLNLGCIAYLMENTAISIKYKNDSQIGKIDFLQGIKQTIDRGGGDCEDYSLFFKALLNTLKLKLKSTNVTIELFKPNPGTYYIIYPLKRDPQESYWYYPDSIAHPSLKITESYFYSICYLNSETEGHCVVGISKNNINNSEELGLLEKSELFEPQNGRYVGNIEMLDSGELIYCWQEEKDRICKKIIIIISDKDIYYSKKGKYFGLEDYKKKIIEILN